MPTHRPFTSVVVSIASVIAGGAVNLAAESGSNTLHQAVLNVWLENDLVVKTDQHYTHGSRIAYAGHEHSLDAENLRWDGRIARWLPDMCLVPEVWRTSFAVTQNIYTPRDTELTTIIPEERPYAGWLYATGALQIRGASSGGTPMLDYWAMNLGAIGPASLAEESQNTIHRIRGLAEAQGWGNQLKNEVDVGIRYGRGLRYSAPIHGEFASQFLPFAGAQLGTVQTFASVGSQWRLGWRLPDDFGWRSIDDVMPASGGRTRETLERRGCYIFLGVEARYYGHNSLVEGNLFHDSHSVQIRPLLGEVKIGVVYSGKRWDVAYTHMIRTKEFRSQEDLDSFGSLSVAFKW
jgi:hypothetical protein